MFLFAAVINGRFHPGLDGATESRRNFRRHLATQAPQRLSDPADVPSACSVDLGLRLPDLSGQQQRAQR